MKWINKIRSWWCKLWKKPDPEEQVREILNQAFDKFADLLLSGGVVNTYKNAIVIQDAIEGDWGDIWDFSLWEDRRVIGWTMVDHWSSKYKEMIEKPRIMIADVYEYDNGSYGVDMESGIDLEFRDGHWYLV